MVDAINTESLPTTISPVSLVYRHGDAHLVGRLGVERLDLQVSSNVTNAVRRMLGSRRPGGCGRSGRIEQSQEDRGEQFVERRHCSKVGVDFTSASH